MYLTKVVYYSSSTLISSLKTAFLITRQGECLLFILVKRLRNECLPLEARGRSAWPTSIPIT
ncbi:hypothetical protein J14TS5_41560 [Paenibacillus lautus]|nr:hypothetical protein J14TS5_41560 [Paenibacillus lautus]